MPAEELFEYFDFENRTYFYHITGSGVGEIICDEGLAMADSHIWSTMIEIKPEYLENISNFLDDQLRAGLRGTEEMVIIATDKGDENHLIIRNSDKGNSSWNEETDAAYIVPRGKVLGYIDLTSPDYLFIPNPNCYAYELEDMPISL